MASICSSCPRRYYSRSKQYYPNVCGQALYAAGRYEDAEDVLQECLLRAPEERNWLRIRAAVLVTRDRLEEARTIVARLSEVDPTFSLSAERETPRFGVLPLMGRYLADLEAAGAPAARGRSAPPPWRPVPPEPAWAGYRHLLRLS